MDIQQTTQAAQAATQPTATPAADAEDTAQAENLITSDFEAFLRLLTTQLENQDPLNPLESTDFATQLATFSGVEQQVRTNTLLGDLQSNLALMGMGQLAGWIGMEARAPVPVNFAGDPVRFAADPPAIADRMELVVSNESGAEVQRISLPVTSDPMEWTGTNANGDPILPGTYSLSIESFQGAELIETEDAMVYSRIEEAFQRGSETWLTFAGGQQVAASEVRGVRAAE